MRKILIQTLALWVLLLVPLSAWAIVSDYFTAHEDHEVFRDLNLIDGDHTNKVLRWIRNNRIDMAIADIKFTLTRFPNHPRALLLMESVARVSKVPQLPLPYYEHALEVFPQYAVTYGQYGRYLAEIGKVDEGIQQLNMAVEIDPDYAATYAWLAEVYSKTGQTNLAKQAAKRARELGYQHQIIDEPGSISKKKPGVPEVLESVKRKKIE